jgi:hypothetical protein
MGVKLLAASGGSVELVPTNTASNFTMTVPAVTATVLTDSAGVLNIGSGQIYKDASGNVGIGTSSPTSVLQLSRSGGASLTATSTGGGANWEFGCDASGNGYIYTGQAKYLALSTSGSERARIDSSGNLLVGTTSSVGTAQVLVNTYKNGGAAIGFATKPSTNVNYDACDWYNSSGTNVGYISCTSSATTYSTTSDYRLKENVQPMTGALEKVAQLKPITYTWKIDGTVSQGFIAH